WNHAKNEELKQARPDPSLLAPGDILQIPSKSKEGKPAQKGTSNEYTAHVPKVTIAIVLKNMDEEGAPPYKDEPYVLEGLGEPVVGTTDGEGKISFTVPVHVAEVSIDLYKRRIVFPVRLGHLDPVEVPSGVKQRLEHLGYYGPYFHGL